MPDKPAYTPAEFAALFGKERTWGYRQIYAGKVNAVTIFGSIMIPVEEVEKAMAGASRYGVTGNSIQRKAAKKKATKRREVKEHNTAWKKYLSYKREMQMGDNTASDGKTTISPSSPIAKGSQHRGLVIGRLRRSSN